MNIKQVIKKLNEICELKEDWDSYGSVPVDDIAIFNCLAIVQRMPNAKTPSIVPTNAGKIQIEWNTNAIEYEIICDKKIDSYSFVFEHEEFLDASYSCDVYEAMKYVIKLGDDTDEGK